MQKACSFKDKVSGNYQLPQWASNIKKRQQYRPSHNVAPTDVTPILVSGSHFNGESERMLQPMMWGMIPIWHKVRMSGEAVKNVKRGDETVLKHNPMASYFHHYHMLSNVTFFT